MISDEKRHEVAQTLRVLDESIDEWGESRPLEHDAMVLRAIRAVVGNGDIFQRLADFIDLPTCRNIYDEDEDGACANGFQCSDCGHVVEDCEGYRVRGTWNYCPQCGAEVLDEDGAN